METLGFLSKKVFLIFAIEKYEKPARRSLRKCLSLKILCKDFFAVKKVLSSRKVLAYKKTDFTAQKKFSLGRH